MPGTEGDQRLANLLGALALTVTDQVASHVADAVGTGTSGAAALVTLTYEPEIGVNLLAQRLRISQPAATRVVDTLEREGHVRRRRTGRYVALHLTWSGKQAAQKILRGRAAVLTPLLADLDARDRAALERCLEQLLSRAYTEVGDEKAVCRLCDLQACLEGGATCPVGQAARDRASTE